jgi:trans-AT polyketide synthase/acyltransferase/oxidoreductase domain-containing protein
MGGEVFAQYPDLVTQAEAILGYSLRDICLNNVNAKLDKTEITQPAIYVVSMLEYRWLIDKGGAGVPDFVAGHSLGEYAALAAAEVFGFGAGLRIVQRRGALMGEAYGGGLVAIVGAKEQEVERLLREDGISGVELANINSPEQVVVGGRKDKLQALLAACAARSLRAVPLRVSGAFHTSQMAEAAKKFSTFLNTYEFAAPKIPVVANVHGRPHEVHGIRDRLVEQMVKPVRWKQCVETMLDAGVTEFVEVGATRVLTPLIASVRRAWESPAPSPEPAPEPKNNPAACLRPVPDETRFCESFHCTRPLVVGSLGNGMAGVRLVKALARSGVLSFLDTDGVDLKVVDDALGELFAEENLRDRAGVSLCADLEAPGRDGTLVDLLLRHDVRCVEVRGYPEPTEALRRYRDARGRDRGNRIIARVGTLEAAFAFISGSLPTRSVTSLPAPQQTPWVDALCIDLESWRSRQGAPITLLRAMLEWRDTRHRSKSLPSFFVGASGWLGGAPPSSGLLGNLDFAVAGSMYLATREATLDENVKAALLADGAHFAQLPDWHYPELLTRSWSFASDWKLCAASERLQEIYAQGGAGSHEFEVMATELSEPFRSRVKTLAVTLSECADAHDFRTTLRREAKALLFPGIIACDASLSEWRRSAPTPLSAGISAAQLTDHLHPLGHGNTHNKRRHS